MDGKGKTADASRLCIGSKKMTKEFTPQKFNSGMHYTLLDKRTVVRFTTNNNKRVLCKMNDQVQFHCAIMPKKEGGYFINVGSTICKNLKSKKGLK